MGLADRVRADLTQADTADLALLDQFGQGRDRGLNGTLGSTRAHSKTSMVFAPPSTLATSSTEARMPSGLPLGPVLMSKAPLMLSTTLLASSGYVSK